MTVTDHQYAPSKDTPLISLTHPTRYEKPPTNVDYEFIHSGVLPPTNNKNTVVMSNLTYKNHVTPVKKLVHKVEKTKTKELDVRNGGLTINKKFKDLSLPQHGPYYLLGDLDSDISDTYYLCPMPITFSERTKPFQSVIPNAKLSQVREKSDPIGKLVNLNNRPIKSRDTLKKV